MADRETIERVVRAAYAARIGRDVDGMMRHFTDMPHFSLAGSTAASPVPLSAIGQAAIREVMARLAASFDFVSADLVTLIVEGDRAAVQWRIRLRAAPSGEEVDTEVVDVVRFEGDRIASFHQFADTALAASLLGR